jgi:hypothetical protein
MAIRFLALIVEYCLSKLVFKGSFPFMLQILLLLISHVVLISHVKLGIISRSRSIPRCMLSSRSRQVKCQTSHADENDINLPWCHIDGVSNPRPYLENQLF